MAYRNGDACPSIVATIAAAIVVAMIMLPANAVSAESGLPASQVRTSPTAGLAQRWDQDIADAARRFEIPERWIRAVMNVESRNDRRAVSPKGAMGLMQIMPKTWNELRARYGLGHDPWQPRANILAGAAYLREMHDRYGSIAAMLAAYNAGPKRYDAHLANGRPLPAETVAYVAKIAPMIDGKVPVMRLAGVASRKSWSLGPIFVGRSSVHHDGEFETVDPPSGRPSNAPAIVDLSALVPPSDGIFVRRSRTDGAQR